MLVASAYVLMQVAVPIARSLRFALVSLAGVALVFDWTAAAALVGIGAVLWLLLRPVAVVPGRAGGGQRRATVTGWMAIALLAAVFAGYKLGFALSDGEHIEPDGAVAAAYRLLRAVSFSYVFVRAVDLVRSVAWGRQPLLDPLSLAGYLGPFHMLLSGPIAPYADHVKADTAPVPPPTFTRLVECGQMIVTGLFMKVVIAQSMKIFLYGVHDPIVVTTWWDTAYLMVYLYFDFGGYSLMALGIGRLLAVPTPRNFNKPLLATSVTDFWTRWHMSLGGFVRNNLFIPLQMFVARRLRRRTLATVAGVLPLAISFMFVAVWHRLSVPLLLWGVSMAVVMVIEKLLRDHALARGWGERAAVGHAWRVVGPIYTTVVIITGVHFIAKEIFVA